MGKGGSRYTAEEYYYTTPRRDDGWGWVRPRENIIVIDDAVPCDDVYYVERRHSRDYRDRECEEGLCLLSLLWIPCFFCPIRH